MTQTNFIPRKFKNIESNDILDFDTLIQNSSISVVLGEPASGKTFQLKEYAQNKNSKLFLLKMLSEYKKKDIEQYDIILLDSIDEALLQNKDNDILIHRLIQFVERYKKKKIIITCRYLEWKENFEEKLKEVDKELKVYDIQELSKDDINLLLKDNHINDFWDFIEKNHLELLLKNIMIVKHLTSNFRKEYQQKNISYIDIYQKIVEQSIKSKGTKREHKQDKRKVKKLFPIGASLATYMMLNRKDTILNENINDIENFVDELYQVENKDIKDNDLKKILDTALFEKKGDNFSFFHKSIQEYLTAYFISYKKLDSETIKRIFSHKLRFYKEFEEVIIYLTNIQPHLFNDFVDFDPFIFRRHPSLTTEQQEKLFLTLVTKYKKRLKEESYRLKQTSLVKFDKLDNLEQLVKENITLELIDYLCKILEVNYSKGIEDFIFKLLENIKEDKILCTKIIKKFELPFYKFNLRLFKFIKSNNCYSSNNNSPINTIEAYIFNILYKSSSISFSKLIVLLQYLSTVDFHFTIREILPNDLLIWENRVKTTFEIDNLEWLIFGMLYNYKTYNSINILEDIIVLIKKYIIRFNIHFSSVSGVRNSKKLLLNFDDISNDFWNLFFVNKENSQFLIKILIFYKMDEINIDHIIKKYPIQNYTEQYFQLIPINNEIESFFIEQRNQEINSTKEYRELFWYFEKNNMYPSQKKEFIKLSNIYFDYFIKLIIILIEKNISNENFNFTFLNKYINIILIDLNKLKAQYIEELISTLAKILKNTYTNKNFKEENIDIILQILILDKNQYQLIKEVLIFNINNPNKYLRALFYINPNQAINDFIKIKKSKETISYNILIKALSNSYSYFREYKFKMLDTNHIKKILITSFSSNYNSSLSSNLLSFIYESKDIKLLTYFSSHENEKLANISASLLFSLNEENRNKDKNYKQILDKKAVNQGTANQNILKDDKSTFNYDTLLTDLILISKQILKTLNTLEFEKENHINDKYISGLELQKYNVAGENRVNQGNERDIIVKDENQSEKTIIEALRITSIQKDYIKEHYDKLIGRYDVMGHSVGYILIYVKNKNFQDRWNGYTTYLSEFTNIEDTNISDVANIKVGKNNIKDKIIYHIFINFYSNK